MKVFIKGKERFKFSWSHNEINSVTGLSSHVTECLLWEPFKGETKTGDNPYDLITSAFALCSKKDQFSRDTGRQISMSRAMRGAKLEKTVRAECWYVYFTMTNNKHRAVAVVAQLLLLYKQEQEAKEKKEREEKNKK